MTGYWLWLLEQSWSSQQAKNISHLKPPDKLGNENEIVCKKFNKNTLGISFMSDVDALNLHHGAGESGFI